MNNVVMADEQKHSLRPPEQKVIPLFFNCSQFVRPNLFAEEATGCYSVDVKPPG